MKKVNFGSTAIGREPKAKGAPAHATANKAPALIRQSTKPMDSAKPGGDRPWPMAGQTSRNKWHGKKPDPDAPPMLGLFGDLF